MISAGADDGIGHGAMQHACHLVTHKTEKSTIARDGDMHAAEQVDIVGTHIDPVFSAGAGDGIGHGVMQPSCQMMTDETEKSTIARDGDMQASKQVDIVGQHIGPVFFRRGRRRYWPRGHAAILPNDDRRDREVNNCQGWRHASERASGYCWAIHRPCDFCRGTRGGWAWGHSFEVTSATRSAATSAARQLAITNGMGVQPEDIYMCNYWR